MLVKICDTQADFFRIQRIRRDVFRIEQQVDCLIEEDEKDDTAVHIIAYKDNKPVGTCRLLEQDDCYVLGRLAVLSAIRKQGVASAILKYVEGLDIVKKKHKIVLHAQFHAYKFYADNGYHEVGDHFYEAGIEHVQMEKEV